MTRHYRLTYFFVVCSSWGFLQLRYSVSACYAAYFSTVLFFFFIKKEPVEALTRLLNFTFFVSFCDDGIMTWMLLGFK